MIKYMVKRQLLALPDLPTREIHQTPPQVLDLVFHMALYAIRIQIVQVRKMRCSFPIFISLFELLFKI